MNNSSHHPAPPVGTDAPTGYPQPPAWYPPPTAAPKRGTDPLAVMALLFSTVGLGLIGVILAAISLTRIRRTGAGGRGLAVAAIVVAALWTALLAGIVLRGDAGPASSAPSASPAPSAPVAGGAGQDVERVRDVDLKVGDCVTRASKNGTADLSVVPCAAPHDSEVIGEYRATGGVSYPGEPAIAKEAQVKCSAFLAQRARAAELSLYYLYPREGDWLLSDKKVQCLAQSDGAPLTSRLATD